MKDYQVHLTPQSSNIKTGPIPVSTTTDLTCPQTCPFNHMNDGGCYASSGPLRLHWKKVSDKKRGMSWKDFCNTITKLPKGQIWRHNQAGDLPGDGKNIDGHALRKLVKANEGKLGFTYTHYPLTRENIGKIFKAIYNNFTINISLNTLKGVEDIYEKYQYILPLTVVVDETFPRKLSYKGIDIVTCPATYMNTNCEKCKLCQKSNRKVVVAFPVHGSLKNKAKKVINK